MNFAEELKNQLNIVDVVSQYVRLKRQGAGQRWVGLCPFHSEKTPSFGVHSGHQYYKCFGCDAAGDVLKFVQQIESLTFPETLRTLAERYGIAMPERSRFDDPESQKVAGLLEIHEAAATIFQENLRTDSGSEARQYLQSRGVSGDVAREFRLGLSDAGGQQLTQRLKKYGEPLLIDSGLVARREAGGTFDRFRGRLMFPIHDAMGKIIAFGGRALRAEDKVKYLNSPETRLYSKSSVLFNMHRAKVAARKNCRMILVEGYMDAIGIFSTGREEVVAICGTALGPGQIRAVKQEISYQSGKGHVILNFDSDAAGARSTEKYLSTLLAQGLRVKVLEIPGGIDPDEYIQQHGAGAYDKLLEHAPSYFHWLTDSARKRFDMHTAEGRIDAFKLILPTLEQVHDKMERAAIATEIAEQLGIEREIVHGALRSKSAPQPSTRPRDVSSGVAPNEKLLVACMLASAEARAVVRHYLARSQALEQLELRAIFEALLAAEENGAPFSLGDALAKLETHFQQVLTAIGFAESSVAEEQAADQALDCLRLLEAKLQQTKLDQLKRQIRELEAQGKIQDAIRLMNELDTLTRRPSKSESL